MVDCETDEMVDLIKFSSTIVEKLGMVETELKILKSSSSSRSNHQRMMKGGGEK